MNRSQTLTSALLPREAFIEVFVGVCEHSPWVTEKAYDLGIDDSPNGIESLHQRMADILLSASREVRLMLINTHPDLAGRAVVRGELTASGTSEQAGAGAHGCNAEEFVRFTGLNDTYKAGFGFPFIKAARGNNCYQILVALEECVQHSADEEFVTALAEINKTTLFRLQQLWGLQRRA